MGRKCYTIQERIFRKSQAGRIFIRKLRTKERFTKNMVKIDLITGFLGSGKTTFIRKSNDYLKKSPVYGHFRKTAA